MKYTLYAGPNRKTACWKRGFRGVRFRVKGKKGEDGRRENKRGTETPDSGLPQRTGTGMLCFCASAEDGPTRKRPHKVTSAEQKAERLTTGGTGGNA